MSEQKAKTLDGERARVEDLNIGGGAGKEQPEAAPSGVAARLKRAYRNFNLLLAGMYTGLNCYGTPHTHHSYDDEDESSSKKKPDRRPI